MKTRHNFTLTSEAIDLLRAAAKAQGVSMSLMIEILIRSTATTATPLQQPAKNGN
jgi:tRNA threonylcarbamoyladenosine modification (KEOPS) complex Cgi121 subunit